MGKSGGNFFQNLCARLFASSDPAAIKKRKLKSIAKTLSKGRYKFYRAGSGDVLPALPKFLYEIYKAIAPAQHLFRSMPNDALVKHMVIGFFLTERQKKLEELLTEESIMTKAKTIPIEKLAPQAKEALDQYCADFDGERIGAIEALYKQFLALRDFCVYDYYFLLKKFDSSLRENDFSSGPHFEKINADYIVEDLKDFISVAWVFPVDADWTILVQMFKDMRNTEPISAGTLKKISARLNAVRESRTLEMMLQLIAQDPDYEPQTVAPKAAIAEQYIDTFKSETLGILRKLEAAEKGSKVSDLVQKIYGTKSAIYLKHYTERLSDSLDKKNLHGLAYCVPLNYLKGFLIDYVKKDIREYCDLVLIRGKWTATALSATMSNAYNDLLGASDTITEFDARLAEDGTIGIKLKTLLPRAHHDVEARNIINRLVSDANDAAKEYIMESTRNLVAVGKTIKLLIEDEGKKNPAMLTNWQEIERFSDRPPKDIGIEIYKKIYLFATLIQTCMSASVT
ncbi:MAG: hypothetical protein IJ191_01710 [Treponema sp.]|nr:hypothetical protein [Treponema sp.]